MKVLSVEKLGGAQAVQTLKEGGEEGRERSRQTWVMVLEDMCWELFRASPTVL